MQLSLNDAKSAMWFLGEPGKIKMSLTMLSPGPIDVNFVKLTEPEQLKILIGIRDQILISDLAFETLVEEFKENKKQKSLLAEAKVPVKEEVAAAPKETRQNKFRQAATNKATKLLKKNANVVRKAVLKEVDLEVVNTIIELEQLRKIPRENILIAARERARQLEMNLANRLSVKPPAETRDKRLLPETYEPEVIQEDEEVVRLVIDTENETIISKENI